METQPQPDKPTTHPSGRHPRISRRLFIGALTAALLTIVAMVLFICLGPGRSSKSQDRTISVTGSATLKAEPDEYQFTPSYLFNDPDKGAASAAAIAKQSEIVAGLKGIGISDSSIKTDINSYMDYPRDQGSTGQESYNYTLTVTITQPDRSKAQKLQDYLATTTPQGSVTPYAVFSSDMRLKLEDQARNLATKNARTKADQSAKNLGFKITGVKSVDDSGGRDYSFPMAATMEDSKAGSSVPSVQPGENKFDYSVNVVYYIR